MTVTLYLTPETKVHPAPSIHTFTATSEGDTEYRVPGVSSVPGTPNRCPTPPLPGILRAGPWRVQAL